MLKLAGRDIATWDLPEVSALLDDGPSGEKVVFRVRRDGRDRDVRVRLAEVVR